MTPEQALVNMIKWADSAVMRKNARIADYNRRLETALKKRKAQAILDLAYTNKLKAKIAELAPKARNWDKLCDLGDCMAITTVSRDDIPLDSDTRKKFSWAKNWTINMADENEYHGDTLQDALDQIKLEDE